MKNVFRNVSALFQDLKAAVGFANRMDSAYRASQGQASEPFTAENVQAVAMNLAGLYAADAAAQMLVVTHYGAGGLTDDRYLAVLRRFAQGDFNPKSGSIADLCANLAWRSGQPFRSLERLSRPVNMSFALLSSSERAKDRAQIIEGARFILEHVTAKETSAAA